MWDFFVNYARKATVSAITAGILAAGAAYGSPIGQACAEQVGTTATVAVFGVVGLLGGWFAAFMPKNQGEAVPKTPRK